MRTTLPVSEPESSVALAPNVPAKDQKYPVALAAVVVPAGKTGAVYL